MSGLTIFTGLTLLSFIPTREKILILTPLATAEIHIPTGITAKNTVAIGAAIVGGTALVAYGGYKVHQAGGFSTVSKNLKAKMRETKLEDLKLNEEFKAEKASIKAAGKNNLARIRENAKTEFVKIRNEGAFQRHINRLDPEGRVDPNVMRDLARPSFGKDHSSRESTKIIKDRLRNLDSDEIAALNSGKVKLTDLQGRRGKTARSERKHRKINYRGESP